MKKNTISFLALSAIFGVGAVYVANKWLMQSTTVEKAPDQQQVAVVSIPVATGTILEAKHVRMRAYPDNLLPANAVQNLDDLVGKVAREPLYPGDILRAERLASKGDGSSLASLINESMRAVTIRVDDVVGVAGFLLPGNRVDIFNTFKKNGKTLTEMALENVRVLAIDQSAQNNENKPKVVRAVTVEVSVEQAETLVNARSRGSLQLALRNPIDQTEVLANKPEPEVVVAAPTEPVVAKAAAPVSSSKVDIIRGTTQESVRVDL